MFSQFSNGLIAKVLYKLLRFYEILRISELLPDAAVQVMNLLIVEAVLGKVSNDIPLSLI